MKNIFIIAFLYSILNANILDDINMYKAKSYLDDKNYDEAYKAYEKVSNKSDEVHYNMANALYEKSKYEEAILHYDKISKNELLFKKLHNLGNTYAKLDKLDFAIKKYEEALKIKKDKDTQFNLDLLKKKKEEQEKKKEEDKKDKDKKDDGKKKDDKNKSDQDSQDKKKKEEAQKNENEKEVNEKKDNVSNDKDENQKKEQQENKEEKEEDNNNTKQETVENTDLSHLEEKRWTKMLNNRELNTLMIPLKTKGEKNDQNIKPW